jgi:hypothetical protein
MEKSNTMDTTRNYNIYGTDDYEQIQKQYEEMSYGVTPIPYNTKITDVYDIEEETYDIDEIDIEEIEILSKLAWEYCPDVCDCMELRIDKNVRVK